MFNVAFKTHHAVWLLTVLICACQTPVASNIKPKLATASVPLPSASPLPTTTPLPCANIEACTPTPTPTSVPTPVISPISTPTPFPTPPPLPAVTVLTLAGSEIPGDKEGFGTEAQLFSPTGLAYTPDGTLIIADTGNYRLRQMLTNGQVKPFVGSTVTGSTFGDVSRVRFTAPVHIVIDKLGYFYLVDRTVPILKKISPTGFTESWISSDAFFSMYLQPEFGSPEQLAIDSQSNLWVTTDTRLWRITPSGTGRVVLGSQAGFPAPLKAISGLATDADGKVWISDNQSHRLFYWTSNTGLQEIAGNGAGFADGLGRAARFNNPQGLSIGPDGLVYVADSGNYRIRRVTTWGEVQTLAGQGTPGLKDGPGHTARFKQLRTLTWSPSGDLVVSDSSTLRRVQLNP